jgi:hypothetical protein
MLQGSLVGSAAPAVRLCGISYRIAAMAGGALTRTSGQSGSLPPWRRAFCLPAITGGSDGLLTTLALELIC